MSTVGAPRELPRAGCGRAGDGRARHPLPLDVRLRPTSLQPEELRRLRSLSRGAATDGTVLSAREEDSVVAFSEKLIQQAECCFEIEVTLAQKQRPVSSALRAAAGRVLYGGAGSAETSEVTLEQRCGLLRPAGDASPAGREPDPKVVARLMMAALSREEIPEEERRDFFLFVDEFQNFTTPTIASLLSEARKYRLSLTLANQTLFQLDDEIVDAVLGNAGSLVALRPGVKDYQKVEPYVSPPFRREEVVNLPNYRAVGRLLAGGEPTRPFQFRTVPRLEKSLSDRPASEES